MFGCIGKFTLRVLAGANVATILLMFLVGMSDRLNPADYPLLSLAGLSFPVFAAVNMVFLVFWIFLKERMVIIPIAGFIICYGPMRIYSPLNVIRPAPSDAIKVLSYNVWLFHEWEDPDEPSVIIDYLLRQDADIVCLQEAGLYGRRLQRLHELMGNAYRYSDTTCVAGNDDVIMLFSKFPILGRERIHYKSRNNHSSAFRLDISGDTVVFIANHLESIGLSQQDKHSFKTMVSGNMKTDSARSESRRLIDKLSAAAVTRSPQAEAVAEYVSRCKGRAIIMCGDFNDSPLSYVRRTMAQGLADCYVESANGPGISYHMNGFYVRIDNIMCSDHWVPYACKVDNSIGASDHYPIICWLKKRSVQP